MDVSECSSWSCRLLEAVQTELIVQVIAALIVIAIVWLLAWITSKIVEWLRLVAKLKAVIAALKARLRRGLGAVALVPHGSDLSEGSGVWLTGPIRQPPNRDAYENNVRKSIPIWVFANLKGGVGKTTNATNLAAHYAMQPDTKPVLLIDLDYQGSASSMSVITDVQIPPRDIDSAATRLIRGDFSVQDILTANPVQKTGMDNLPLQIVPAYYDLAQAENRLMIEWLFGESPRDVRYRLAELLHDPSVQEHFSRVIIDAPPRLTTACIQALCAATHVLVPTILDHLSIRGADTFLQQIQTLKTGKVCPHIEVAGVIGFRPGNPAGNQPQYIERQLDDAEDKIRDALRNNRLSEALYLSQARLVHSPLLAESAGHFIAIARNNVGIANQLVDVRTMINNLAEAIEESIRTNS